MMLVGDVPVETGQQLVVALVSGEAGPRTGIITILAGHIIRNGLQIRNLCTRDVIVYLGNAIGRTSPTVDHRRCLHHFTIGEEEQFVLNDRTTQRETVGCGLCLLTCTGNLLTLYGITLHILILVIDIGTTLESVRTRLRNGVHTTTDEVSLTNIIRRNHHLQLLDGIDRDRITTTRQVRAQTEVVVEVGTVDGEVGCTTISTCEAHTVTTIR